MQISAAITLNDYRIRAQAIWLPSLQAFLISVAARLGFLSPPIPSVSIFAKSRQYILSPDLHFISEIALNPRRCCGDNFPDFEYIVLGSIDLFFDAGSDPLALLAAKVTIRSNVCNFT